MAWGQETLSEFRRGVGTWNIILGLGDMPHYAKFNMTFNIAMNGLFVFVGLINWIVDLPSVRTSKPMLNMIGGLLTNAFECWACMQRPPLMPYLGIIGQRNAEIYDTTWWILRYFHGFTIVMALFLMVLNIFRSCCCSKKKKEE
eukprot:gnl/TRDRNA2_/TRDRNA2_182547_c0_seq1.p1 gnl/TRDRNA2_/TRDRNA2_182547_c0~~gnl/TRDRNA2_/TRDRNA2_182547_c0_seq1.p1  ORF type:complete len:144 (+),score=25.72 gnl/TRDRNA2_/TRDRNA2_182547_c0_seq1:111-542(+)